MNNLDFLRTFERYEENTSGQTQSTTGQGTTSTTTIGANHYNNFNYN